MNNLAGEDGNIDQPSPRWFIDLGWLEQNRCSISALAHGCLCSRCRERLGEEEGSTAQLLSTIRDCCSSDPEFIVINTPILESIFRVFLAGGNQPLDLEELGSKLRQWRGGDTYCTSAEILSRLLKKGQCYGLRAVSG